MSLGDVTNSEFNGLCLTCVPDAFIVIQCSVHSRRFEFLADVVLNFSLIQDKLNLIFRLECAFDSMKDNSLLFIIAVVVLA